MERTTEEIETERKRLDNEIQETIVAIKEIVEANDNPAALDMAQNDLEGLKIERNALN